jgi:hypothetical protein
LYLAGSTRASVGISSLCTVSCRSYAMSALAISRAQSPSSSSSVSALLPFSCFLSIKSVLLQGVSSVFPEGLRHMRMILFFLCLCFDAFHRVTFFVRSKLHRGFIEASSGLGESVFCSYLEKICAHWSARERAAFPCFCCSWFCALPFNFLV